MTAPMRGTPRLSALPASQNTAPVAEFRCLFTHDTRKKQKKWQDGYLKFHSFNNRVIVYDASRFTVGDTYYKDGNELHEGDELMLDKGVMVEVAEAVGTTQTDLTPLFERKSKESPQRPKIPGLQRPLPRPTIPASNPLRAASQLRHKSLNALLGTPRGPVGKAVPIRSPFEERMAKENQHCEERSTKRQKTVHEVEAQRSPRRETASKRLSPLQAQSSRARNDGPNPRPRTTPHGATVITLSSQPETDNIPSDVTLPRTPSRPQAAAPPSNPAVIHAPQEPRLQQGGVHTTPRIPKGKVPVPHVKAQQTPRKTPPPSSPPVSASNRIANVDFAVQPASDPTREVSPLPSPPKAIQAVEKKKTKSLKFSSRAKRGMLLCQSAPLRRRTGSDEPKSQTSMHGEVGNGASLQKEHLAAAPHRRNTTECARASIKHAGVDAGTIVGPSLEATKHVPGTEQAPLEILDEMELAHGFMDQQLLVSPSPPLVDILDKPRSPIIPAAVKKAPTSKPSRNRKRGDDVCSEHPAPKRKRAKDTGTKPTRKRVHKTKSPSPSRSPSPAAIPITTEAPVSEGPIGHSRPSEQPRNNTLSPPPHKLAALSTGGFKKKPKRAQAPSTTSKNPTPVPPAPPTTVTLPPHPLRSSKNGPLMSTTELSALLQNGPKSMRLEDDPIEDGGTQGDGDTDTTASPSKRSNGFARTRSENDVPIPSASEDWEHRNVANHAPPPPPAKQQQQQQKKGNLAAILKRTDPRHKFQRTRSLNVDAGAANRTKEAPEVVSPPLPPPPPVDNDVGPWSSEAFDLFDWRPPGMEWRVEGGRMKLVDANGEGGGGEEDRGVGRLVDGR